MVDIAKKEEDLTELGLTAEEGSDDKKVRLAYLRLSKTRHPDKGGTKESFQKLVNAYERLSSGVYRTPTPATDSRHADCAGEDEGDDYCYDYDESTEEYWYQQHFNFHSRTNEYDNDDHFEAWHKARRSEWARRRRRGIDERDKTAKYFDDTCMFCGVNKAIGKADADLHGLNWKEYDSHPCRYRTCWGCKDAHKSVMTKKMACKAFAKKLDVTYESRRTGVEYHPVFWFLKLDGKSFHHQPVTECCRGPTRNSEYFWYPDLEEEALARGWKPRGKKKDEVPWTRKDVRNAGALVVTPDRAQVRPRKRKASSR